jgi:magnesium chelatase subunit I
MHAEIRTVKDPELRVRIVEERAAFDRNYESSITEHYESQEQLKKQILSAQELLPTVTLDQAAKIKIAEVCSTLDIDGLRGDIVTNRAAKAYTAYSGRTEVTVDDIKKVVCLCLRHRLRKDPLETINSGSRVEKIFNEIFAEE